MENRFSRTEILIGKDKIKKLEQSSVAIFGVGGVGGYVCEALARSSVGTFYLIDKDTVSISNINRQIIATTKTIGMDKTKVMKDRILDINPNAKVEVYNRFFLPENSMDFDFSKFDYVIDAVDTVAAKLELIKRCDKENIPIISSMGAGNKLDPTMFKVSDIFNTKVCPLAKVVRRELRKLGIEKLKVVYSEEEPIRNYDINIKREDIVPGSIAFVPSSVGLIIAREVIKDIISK